jgi:hypothetical protein
MDQQSNEVYAVSSIVADKAGCKLCIHCEYLEVRSNGWENYYCQHSKAVIGYNLVNGEFVYRKANDMRESENVGSCGTQADLFVLKKVLQQSQTFRATPAKTGKKLSSIKLEDL